MTKTPDIPVWLCADPGEFCPRHKGNSVVRRCHHFGHYYVSEMRLSKFGTPQPCNDWGHIDYVCDTNDGWLVEGHFFRTLEEGEQLWRELLKRMLAGDPPDKEKGD